MCQASSAVTKAVHVRVRSFSRWSVHYTKSCKCHLRNCLHNETLNHTKFYYKRSHKFVAYGAGESYNNLQFADETVFVFTCSYFVQVFLTPRRIQETFCCFGEISWRTQMYSGLRVPEYRIQLLRLKRNILRFKRFTNGISSSMSTAMCATITETHTCLQVGQAIV